MFLTNFSRGERERRKRRKRRGGEEEKGAASKPPHGTRSAPPLNCLRELSAAGTVLLCQGLVFTNSFFFFLSIYSIHRK